MHTIPRGLRRRHLRWLQAQPVLQTRSPLSGVDVQDGHCLDTKIQHEGGEDPAAQQESRDLGAVVGYDT